MAARCSKLLAIYISLTQLCKPTWTNCKVEICALTERNHRACRWLHDLHSLHTCETWRPSQPIVPRGFSCLRQVVNGSSSSGGGSGGGKGSSFPTWAIAIIVILVLVLVALVTGYIVWRKRAARRVIKAQEFEAASYFDLAFAAGGPWQMPLTAAGTWLRSHLFGLPFGDQGFCLRRASFMRLGGFDEAATCGEDHFFVWAAKRQGLALRCTGRSIATSARKYAANGWWATTWTHLCLTLQQARQGWTKCRT